MKTFRRWITDHFDRHQLLLCLSLLEAADYFDPASYNQVFEDELERLRRRMDDDDVLAALDELKGLDWGGYIAKELRKAGFRGSNVDEYVHHIVVKLLVTPGKLFNGWNPDQHGPLDRRFGASVRNEIRNIVDKESNRRKYVPTVSISNDYNGHGIGEKYLPPSPTQSDPVVDDFRDWLSQNLGDLAVAIFDARLNGEAPASLVGSEHLGSPTNNRIRTTTQAIKQAALEYANGDSALRDRIQQYIDQDRQTAERMRTAGQQHQQA